MYTFKNRILNFFYSWNKFYIAIMYTVNRHILHPQQCGTQGTHFCIVHIPERVIHLLQMMNVLWHIIITQSPWFTLGFTLGGMPSMDLNIHTCFISTQSVFIALKIALFLLNLAQPLFLLVYLPTTAIFTVLSRMWNHWNSWNHICSLFKWAFIRYLW